MIQIASVRQLFPVQQRLRQRRLLSIFAHPDDESLHVSGLLFQASKEKIPTFLVCLTQGEKGVTDLGLTGNRLKQKRHQELLAATKLLGIHRVVHLNFPDGKLAFYQSRIRDALKRIISEIKPQVILTFDPSGFYGHPDHIATSLAVKSCFPLARQPAINLYFSVSSLPDKWFHRGAPWRLRWPTMPTPTHRFHAASYADLKANVCLCYRTQPLRSFPLPFRVWFRMFDWEYLHCVNLRKRYPFHFQTYSTPHISFTPSRDEITWA